MIPEMDPDEGHGEARRNADGTIQKLHMLSDDDDEEDGSGSEGDLAWATGYGSASIRARDSSTASSAVSTTRWVQDLNRRSGSRI